MRNSGLEERVRRRLSALDADGLRRALQAPAGIDLSSNDYLNLAAHPLVTSRLVEAVARDGCGSTGSRLVRGERASFSAVERRFAGLKRTDRSLYFSSGYLANLAVLSTLPEAGDTVFSDERNHASLIDGMRLSRATRIVFPHGDVACLAGLLAERRGSGHPFVVTESLFSMDGDLAPLEAYAELCRTEDATLVVDEAHAVGVYGPRGSGLIEDAALDANACISINAAGKALGVAGAFVAGPEWAIEYLLQRARTFVFSTAAPPALADAIDASLTVLAGEPERRALLLERARRFRASLGEAGIAVPAGGSQIVPVVIGANDTAVAVARALQGRGYDVRAIRPPTVPPGTARLRVSVNVGLSDQTLDRFVSALAGTLQEAGLCSAGCS